MGLEAIADDREVTTNWTSYHVTVTIASQRRRHVHVAAADALNATAVYTHSRFGPRQASRHWHRGHAVLTRSQQSLKSQSAKLLHKRRGTNCDVVTDSRGQTSR